LFYRKVSADSYFIFIKVNCFISQLLAYSNITPAALATSSPTRAFQYWLSRPPQAPKSTAVVSYTVAVRGLDRRLTSVPRTHKTFGDRSFASAGPRLSVAVADPKILNWGGDNLSAPSSFIANAHNEI